MVSTFTTNLGLEKPARGDQVGTWDTPVNGNMNLVDAAVGGSTTVALTNAPVVLSSAQYQNATLIFSGALTGNCLITFPSLSRNYTIFNITTNTSAFAVTFTTTGPSAQVLGIPADVYTASEIVSLGTGFIGFRGLDRVGTLWEYGGSSVPRWVGDCSVPPYLNCDGSGFSSATYPTLAAALGGTTLPDLRGSYRANLNQGTGRITTIVNANNNLARGGADGVTLGSSNIPAMNVNITDPGHVHAAAVSNNSNNTNQPAGNFPGGGGTAPQAYNTTANSAFNSSFIQVGFTNISASLPGGGNPFNNGPPTTVVGITLIRAG